MKLIKKDVVFKIAACIAISIIIQTNILLLIRKFYLNTNLEIKFTNVTTQGKVNKSSEKEDYISLPQNAKDINLSYNGDYIFYVIDGKAHVINYETKKDNTLEMDLDEDNTYFKWHDSENKLIISKTNCNGNSGIMMYYYNPKTNEVLKALDYNNEQRIYYLNNEYEKVTDIKINNINTILYLKISSENNDWINRLDISGQTNRLYTNSNYIGNYFVIKELDQLIYEDLESKKIFTIENGYNREMVIGQENSLKILAVQNGFIYLGKLENGLIKSIYNKNIFEINNEESNWDKIDIEGVKEENILFDKGKIYINNLNKVINVTTNKEYSYLGSLLCIKEDNLIVKEGTKIKKVLIK